MPSSSKTAPRLTTTSFAVLGLLSVRTWTTYELAKQVGRSLRYFWPRAERKLYDEPKTLVAGGLATATREFQGQRPRTVYEITDRGREELARWLGEPPAPPALDFEGMIKVFFCDSGSLEQLHATLDAVEAEAAGRIRALGAMAEEYVHGGPRYPGRAHISAISLSGSLESEAAMLEWARRTRQEIRGWRSTTDPGTWDSRALHARIAERARYLTTDTAG